MFYRETDVMEALSEIYVDVLGSPVAERTLLRIKQAIKELETVDAAPVVPGEWRWDNRCGLYTCSRCGALSPRENQDGEYIDCPTYCHECGAKMRGGADNG